MKIYKSILPIQYNPIVLRVCIIAALGGLLFGLDQGFIANSFSSIQSHYNITLHQMESYSAILAYGGVLGAFLSGIVTRLMGRQKTLVLAGLLFTVTTALSASLPPFSILTVCRFFIGVAIGISSFIVPLYLAEVAPKQIRGAMGALFQLMITFGIFLISITNIGFAKMFETPAESIPFMFALVCLFAVAMFTRSLKLPESPRFLALQGKETQAKEILRSVRNNDTEVNQEMAEIHNNLEDTALDFSFLKQRFFWKILFVCMLIPCFQQLVGINMMIYYAPTIFEYAKITGVGAMMLVPTVNVVFTIPAIFLVEKWGRKNLLYLGSVCMFFAMCAAGISLISIGSQIPTDLQRYSLFGSIILYIFGFSISWGPVAWILCSELFPQNTREFGLTLSTMINWVFAGLVLNISLSVMETYGTYVPFFVFAVFCFLSILFVKQFVPETKNIMLEKLESDLKHGVQLRYLGHGSMPTPAPLKTNLIKESAKA